ncbi:alpha-L-fucosidase [Streptomyces coerulescens]|uniref:alpha-L-fucosidase n=1 Tax=Streptomyces coerulescens TaxID=29304 RepID=A0ABW0D0V2_STRCD
MAALPAAAALSSPAYALGGLQSAVAGPAAGLAAQDPGAVLASLRFGMFVHFNPSSVVGREIGWGRNAFRPGEAPGNQYHDPSVKSDPVYDAAYRDFLPAEDWAPRLAAKAKAVGMNYLVFTTKHHDGYPNFRADNVTRSAYPDYADTPMGRSGRDLTREIAEAARSAGLKIGFYYSQRDWTQPDYGKADYATYNGYMRQHLDQLLTQYGKIDFMWYDSIPYADRAVFQPPSLYDVPRSLQPGILVNDRAYTNMGYQPLPAELAGDFDTPEGHVGSFNVHRPWESCISVTPNGWSWQPNAALTDYPTALRMVSGTAVGGGNLLLNVPPMKTGYLEDRVNSVLDQVGSWMNYHERAVVDTRGGPYRSNQVAGATYRDDYLYLHIFDDFRTSKLRLPRLGAKVTSAACLDGRRLPFTETATGEVLLDLSGYSRGAPVFVVELRVDRNLTIDDVTSDGAAWAS